MSFLLEVSMLFSRPTDHKTIKLARRFLSILQSLRLVGKEVMERPLLLSHDSVSLL
jgi:hypothetical protein